MAVGECGRVLFVRTLIYLIYCLESCLLVGTFYSIAMFSGTEISIQNDAFDISSCGQFGIEVMPKIFARVFIISCIRLISFAQCSFCLNNAVLTQFLTL